MPSDPDQRRRTYSDKNPIASVRLAVCSLKRLLLVRAGDPERHVMHIPRMNMEYPVRVFTVRRGGKWTMEHEGVECEPNCRANIVLSCCVGRVVAIRTGCVAGRVILQCHGCLRTHAILNGPLTSCQGVHTTSQIGNRWEELPPYINGSIRGCTRSQSINTMAGTRAIGQEPW